MAHPIVIGEGFYLEVTPAITNANTYGVGYVIGGPLTFAKALGGTNKAILHSLTIKFANSVQTGELDFTLMSALPGIPANYADHAAPTYAVGDSAFIIGTYALTTSYSPFGTHSVYNLDGIGKVLLGNGVSAAGGSVFGLVTTKAALTANTGGASDMTVGMGLIW